MGGSGGVAGAGGSSGSGGAVADSGPGDASPDASSACEPGWADCDLNPANGCEARLDSADSCGQCGRVCAAVNGVASCENGGCAIDCNAGFADCNQNPADGCEANLASLGNCGSCGTVCGAPNSNATCSGGVCVTECLPLFADCDGEPANGCETPLDTSQSCGACGTSCAGTCSLGICSACDDALAVDSAAPSDAAKAMGICTGLDDAKWVLPDGALPQSSSLAAYHLGHGILSDFGPNVQVQSGTRLLALSSGTARRPSDPGYQEVANGYDKGYSCNAPLGYPKQTAACPGVTAGTPHDGAALEVTLTPPAQATGIAFRFSFYTSEWPDYVCSEYNDFFLALMSPMPPLLPDANLAFDPDGNPFSVNNAMLEACSCATPPCVVQNQTYPCSLGAGPLAGTGFDTHAATGWLETTAPVTPGNPITLRFAIYDSGDGLLDSTVLLDDFRWLTTPGVVVATSPL